MELVDAVVDGFDLAEECGFVLFVEEHPML